MCILIEATRLIKPPYWTLTYGSPTMVSLDQPLPPPPPPQIGGVRYEFGRPQTNSSILYVYRRKTAESSTFYSFMKYSTTVDPSIFDIPSGCKPGK